MTKRFLRFLFFVLLICTSTALSAMPLRILSTMTRYYSHNESTRISEFFTGVEDNGQDTVLRTDNCGRAGIYLVVGLNKFICQLKDGCILRFRYLVSDCKEEKEIRFDLESCGRSPWIFIGITGKDFHGPSQSLVAWSVEICSEGDYAIKNSFLWGMDCCTKRNCEGAEAGLGVL